ncbi:MAG TPA: DUF499 domain-containing protein [bacterium]|nr:DUF499 domain-containing protein [bacterium]HQL63627.1 DUF499 domain-containing protein [bacterium]
MARKLKPWYKVATPREDLRQDRPLDASEFAVHLDQIRDGRANEVYQKPNLFFERTYLTKNLTTLAAETIRRLSGNITETSAVFNMATQFGGGKTHALTLLYHLAKHGPKANAWNGVRKLLDQAGCSSVPEAATAVFVGTEFDSITGRGGEDGTPLRKTPWGEIAFQLGGEEAFRVLDEHEKKMTAPAGDVIRKFLPMDKPCVILMDELINYISRNRKSGMSSQLYSFLQNLCEEIRGRNNAVLAVSLPAYEWEMSAEDWDDYNRYKKLLDRLGKAVILSAEEETSEIIRRRLFDWSEMGVDRNGHILLSGDAVKTCKEYADWILAYRQQLPNWFPIDHAQETFEATYPFHPMLISVFERKWQALPRFQRTRGILRLLALWVSKTYQAGFRGAHHDPLIGTGTAPLDDPMFRAATFEQLGEDKLEGAVTTDITGKNDANASRLDQEAVETIKRGRLHRKVATAIFFESNGGQAQQYATLPEIRLAVAEPDLDIGNIETVLDALVPPDGACYYLHAQKNRYYFSIKANLTRILADRRANIRPERIEELVRSEIQEQFREEGPVKCIFFPEKSNEIPDHPVLTVAVLAPERSMDDRKTTMQFIDQLTREHGQSGRTFKSALIWCVPENATSIHDEARKALACEDVQAEKEDLGLDESQQGELKTNLKKAQRDLRDSIWKTYKNVVLLGKDNSLRTIDLGLNNSSSASSIMKLILESLRKSNDEVTPYIAPRDLIKNWPPAFTEWSTKSVRDAIFASPQFSRLLNPDSVRDTIAKGVTGGLFAYVEKTPEGKYKPFVFEKELSLYDVEISEDTFIITAEEAKKHIEPPRLTALILSPQNVQIEPGKRLAFAARGLDQHNRDIAIAEIRWGATGGTIDKDGVLLAGPNEGSFLVTASVGEVKQTATFVVAKPGVKPPPTPPPSAPGKGLKWKGEVPAQKWMNFYTKVLSRFATEKGLKLTVGVEVSSEGGIAPQKIEETKTALRELGLKDDVET